MSVNPSVLESDPTIRRFEDPRSGQTQTEEEKIIKQYGGLFAAFMALYIAVNNGHNSMQTQAKIIQNNSAAQDRLIAQEGKQKFVTLKKSQIFSIKYNELYADGPPPGAIIVTTKGGDQIDYIPKVVAQQTLDNIAEQNQVISGDRGIMEDMITAVRQGSQSEDANINSTNDEIQQTTQEAGDLTQVSLALANRIAAV